MTRLISLDPISRNKLRITPYGFRTILTQVKEIGPLETYCPGIFVDHLEEFLWTQY